MIQGERSVARVEGLTSVTVLRSPSTRSRSSFRLAAWSGSSGPMASESRRCLSIIAGARQVQSGSVFVLDGDMVDAAHRAAICPRIAYMPQGLGKNLYADLSVRENIEFFGRLFGQSRSERDARIAEL